MIEQAIHALLAAAQMGDSRAAAALEAMLAEELRLIATAEPVAVGQR